MALLCRGFAGNNTRLGCLCLALHQFFLSMCPSHKSLSSPSGCPFFSLLPWTCPSCTHKEPLHGRPMKKGKRFPWIALVEENLSFQCRILALMDSDPQQRPHRAQERENSYFVNFFSSIRLRWLLIRGLSSFGHHCGTLRAWFAI